jgi:catechol 2,3-dioxygenase-like lactoylglutathione lyase family enzyme
MQAHAQRWLLAGILIAASGCSRNDARAPTAPTPTAQSEQIPRVSSLSLTVSDLDRSVAFFRELDFEPVERRELSGSAVDELLGLHGARIALARLRLGAEIVELMACAAPGQPIPADAKSNDAAFQHMAIVVSDMDAAFARLMEHRLETVSVEPQTIPRDNPAAGGIRALYFRDRDRHSLELIWFPAGRGDPRWQRTGDSRVFLGIDHSAIAVKDTETSAPLYRALGFTVAGTSLNYGPEQEALSGVAGARVRITGFASKRGPGVEFLSYLAPGPGRAAPSESSVCDLWHWEITVEVADLADALARVATAGGTTRASDPVDVTALDLAYTRAALVRDLDGHALRLVQR